MVFYAVSNGRNIGIFLNWNDCNNSVKGYKNALFKKFKTKEEADDFIQSNNKTANNIRDINNEKQNPITSFFDTNKCKQKVDINDFNPDYYVYTDGACSNNGKDNALAGIGIFFGINDNRNISKNIEGKQTNNTAELNAIIETYNIIENDIINGKKIAIVSDSEYAIRCVSSYGEKCFKKDWNVDIPNKELVKKAYELYKNKRNIKFVHIQAHTNNTDNHSIGNDNADKLANLSIGLESCPYETSIKIYLQVPFIKKDEIKKLGGMWDRNNKKWFVYDNNKNMEQILTIFSKE
jgi:ribonuclease HI